MFKGIAVDYMKKKIIIIITALVLVHERLVAVSHFLLLSLLHTDGDKNYSVVMMKLLFSLVFHYSVPIYELHRHVFLSNSVLLNIEHNLLVFLLYFTYLTCMETRGIELRENG